MKLKHTSYKNLFDQLDEQLVRYQLNESTLSQLPELKSAPGGKDLIKFLHKTYKLSNTAIWKPLDFTHWDWAARLKSHAILVVIGVNGVAGIKNSGRTGITPGIAAPNNVENIYTWREIHKFNSQGQIYAIPFDKKTDYRMFDKLKTEIGDIKNVWYTDSQQVSLRDRTFVDFQPKFKDEPGSSDHRLLPNTRKNKVDLETPYDSPTNNAGALTRYRNDPDETSYIQAIKIVFDRIKPRMRKIAQKELELVKRKIFNYIESDDYDEGLKLANAAIEIQDILIATDTSDPIDFHNRNKYGLLIDKLVSAIDRSKIKVSDLANMPVSKYGVILSAFRDELHRSLFS